MFFNGCCSPARWILAGAGALGVASWLRYGVLEAGVFPTDCAPTWAALQGELCAAQWLLVQVFMQQRLGWLALALGVWAFLLRRRGPAWGGWLTGLVGLILYNVDYAAVGVLLSLLVLASSPEEIRGAERQGGY